MEYSLITCTYNAEQYIDAYFKVINNIDYDNFEIIIVDDCSIDHTYEKLQNNKRISNRNIIVVQQPSNLGPGEARNAGIQLSSGKRIVFLDVDDKVETKLFRELDKYEADCIYFDYYKCFSNNKVEKQSSLFDCNRDSFQVEEVMRKTNGAVWGKVFKREFIEKNQIRFPQLYKTEDLVFVLRYLLKCKTIAYCKEPLYYYRISSDSAMNRNIENQIFNAEKAMNILEREMMGHEETYKIIYSKEIVYDLTNVYIRLGKSRQELFDFWSNNDLNICVGDNCKYYSKIQRIVFCLIQHRRYLLLKLINKMR